MKAHTNDFKNKIKLMGKEIDSKITFESTVLGKNELNAVTPSFQGAILKSVMKELHIDSNVEIPVGITLNYQFGLKVNGNYEYVDFGNYIVKDVEKQEDTNSYKITCYDKMLYSMVEYANIGISYPISVRDYINSLCTFLGLNFANKNDTFANYDKIIPNELYLSSDGTSIDYTFRDVFDELSQVTASTICINENDEIEIRYINDTNDTIDEEYLKDVNVNFGEKFGKINSIVLSRSGESDNVYLRDEQSVIDNGLCELKIIDNQIMNFNNRSDYLPDILEKLNRLEYYLNDFTSTGITYYDVCDRYSVKVGDKTYSCVMFNDEINVTQGLEEIVYTEMPQETQTDYTKADKTDRKINQTYIIVDKQNQEIELLSSKTEETTKTLKIDKSVESNGETITIEDSGGYDLEKLRIDGKTALVEKITKKSLMEANGELDLSNQTLSVNFGEYTSNEILTSIFGTTGYDISWSFTQFGSIGVDMDTSNSTASIVATTPPVLTQMMEGNGINIEFDRTDLEENQYYIFAMNSNNNGIMLVTTLANISTLNVYNNYKIPICDSIRNEINGVTLNLITGNSHLISEDSIIWNCLLINFSSQTIESLGQNGSIEIEINNAVDTQTTTIELNQPLRSLESGIKDIYENGVITRRVGITENGELYELDEPITEDVGFLSISTFKGLNNINLNSNIPTSFGITYLTDSQLNEIYATKSQIKLTEDEINILSQKVQPVSNKIKGVGQIQLVNAYEGILHRLSIKGNISVITPVQGEYGYALVPSEKLTPSTTLTPSHPVPNQNIIIGENNNLIIDDIEYELDFNFLNYINDTICDEFIYEDGKCWIVRRVGIDENGNLYATGQEVIEPRKDIVLNVKSNSTIKLKSFENAIYETQYLLENEYTDNFVTEVDVISRINLSPGTAVIEATKLAQITADKINLEGYTTINGGFSIDNYGNPTIKTTDEATDFGVDAKLDIIGTQAKTQVNSFGAMTEWHNDRGYKNNCYLGTNNIRTETEGSSYNTEAMLYSDEESATLSLQLYDQNGNPYNGFRINVFPEKKVRIQNQNGGELLMGHTLYENSSGSNGTITLSDSVANFKYIEIYFKDDNSVYNHIKIDQPSYKWVSLLVTQFDNTSSQVVFRGKNVVLSGTTISNGDYCALVNNSSGNTLYWNNNIYITKVVGYR